MLSSLQRRTRFSMTDSPQTLTPPAFTISCQACGSLVPAEPWSWKHDCGGTLQLKLEADATRITACRESTTHHLSRFAPVLPLHHAPETSIGDTPLAIEELDGVRLALKLDYLNPCGSFKERGAYVTAARCVAVARLDRLVDVE